MRESADKAGVITDITVVDGGIGYAEPLLVTIQDLTGNGAEAVASVSRGAVASIRVTNGGRGYYSAPVILVRGLKPGLEAVTRWSHDGTGATGSEPSSAVVVPVSNGLFTVGLGDTNLANMSLLEASIFMQPDLRLRIW